jgi:hypothetical protein
MTYFKADFTYYPTDINLLSAPVRVEFKNESVIAYANDSDEFTYAVDSNNKQYIPTLALSTYLIFNIDKTIWEFGDNTYSNDLNVIKKYEFPGIYTVKLNAYSNDIYDEITGVTFKIVNVKTIDLKIESTILTWLKIHMTQPHLEAMENSQAFKDLFTASSQMYDRMYKEIHDVANLMDIKTVAPKFLEFFSDTLNHKRFYAKKIGYSAQETNENKQLFLDYDIFERITKNIAGNAELELFRQFIIDTANLFKQNGSKTGIEDFFKLYSFIMHIKEMWTTNFEQTSDAPIKDDFFLDATLENTKNKFKFKNLNITGWQNDKVKISGTFNNLLIDNYHFISKHSYPGDAIDSNGCSQTFEINDYNPNVKEIFRDDGRSITNTMSCNGVEILTPCSSSTSSTSGTDSDIKIEKNQTWIGANKLLFENVGYKFWNAPTGYVKSVINLYGVLPSGINEIDESGELGDTSDDYIWGDWKLGVTVPPGIPGLTTDSLRKPSFFTTLPFVNYATTDIDTDLIQLADFPISTKNDFFIVARGFIKIPKDAYYVFSLESGNSESSTEETSQQVMLFSLKHNTNYNINDVNALESLDNISFLRDNTDVVTTIGTTATTNSFNLYSKKGEYGIVELRQNQAFENSGHYYLTEGYYAFEVKATYSSLNSKKLKLYWEAYVDHVLETTVNFENIITKKIIPSINFLSINSEPTSIEDNKGKGYLLIPNEYIEGGDVIGVMYSQSNSDNGILSGIISTEKTYKDCEMNIRFAPNSINEFEQSSNDILPQKTLLNIFRAQYKNLDLYSNIDSYYAVSVDGKRGLLSIMKVEYSKETESSVVFKLNLNPDLTLLDTQMFDKIILDENGYTVEFEDNIYYDLKVIVKNDLVTVKYRKNSDFTNLTNNLFIESKTNILNYTDEIEYTTLVENVSLNQSQKDIFTCDLNNNALNVSDTYYMNSDAGYYGIAVKSSNIKISSFEVISFDKTDEQLSTTIEKYKNIKCKYLDSRPTKNLKYTTNDDQTQTPIYSIQIASSFATSASTIQTDLTNITDNIISDLTLNNLNVNDWGTRFNIVFNRDYLNNRFKTVNEVLDSVVIPFGNFYEPYINWTQIDSNVNGYNTTVQGGYNPFVTENAKILPHTIAISGDNKIYISQMLRNTVSTNLLKTQEPLSTLLEAISHSIYNGVWEEVCPQSSSATWNIVTTNSKYSVNNEVFEVVYRNKNTKTEIIGVKIVNKDVIEELICEYCNDTILWGLYEINLPEYSILNFQKYDDIITSSLINPIRYFIPIGKINKNQDIYLPSPEFLRNENATIQLKGVYVNLNTDKAVVQNKTTIILSKINKWEQKYKSKTMCNYYIDIDTKFYGTLTDYNKNIIDFDVITDPCDNIQEPHNILSEDECNSVPNAYYMPSEIIKLLNYIKDNSLDFENDYNWWEPKTPWLKRIVDPTYPVNGETTIYSGLNSPNYFFSGVTKISGEQGVYLNLNENFYADPGKYILDASWCVTNTAWDSNYAVSGNNDYAIGIFEDTKYLNMGFASTSKSKLGYEKVVPIGINMTVPLSLQTVSISGLTQLHFGSYLKDESMDSKYISPYGLYNWFLGHANPINDISSEYSKINWTLKEFNDQFINCFKFNSVLSQINSAYFKINNYWAFYKNNIPQKNSTIKIREVFDNNAKYSDTTIGVSNGLMAFYAVPSKYIYYPNWVSHVEKIFLDNFTLSSDLYYISINAETGKMQLVLNTQSTDFNFTEIVGNTKIILNIFSDKYDYKNLEKMSIFDNFNTIRDIKWVPLLNINNTYKVAKREIDTELKYIGTDSPYSVINYKGNYCYKLTNKFDYDNKNVPVGSNYDTAIGVTNNNGSIDIINLIDKPSNNFAISCDVIFDETIFNKNFDKKFELILKAKADYIEDSFGINDFYFVGIGTYNFDVGLGMRSIDKTTGELKETYLASYGDFNIKGIKLDIWYTLKAEIKDNYINVFLNEKNSPEKLVLHYNIDKKYEKMTERYLNGEFENLQSVIIGLQQLTVTYPNKLNNTVSADYTLTNFKEEFAKTIPINGYLSGFKVYNPYTYVSNIKFDYYKTNNYKYGFTTDGQSYDYIIDNIKNTYGLPQNPDVKKVHQALNFTIFILINDTLYYQKGNNFTEIYKNRVDNFYIVGDKIFIIEKIAPTDAGIGLNEWSVGPHEIVWSLISNNYNINKLSEFFNYVTNLESVALVRTSETYTLSKSQISSGGYEDVNVQLNDIITFTITGTNAITFPLDGVLGIYDIILRIYQEGFTQEYPILIKDKTFYNDELRSYMSYSNKKINKIVINDNSLNLIFEDI